MLKCAGILHFLRKSTNRVARLHPDLVGPITQGSPIGGRRALGSPHGAIEVDATSSHLNTPHHKIPTQCKLRFTEPEQPAEFTFYPLVRSTCSLLHYKYLHAPSSYIVFYSLGRSRSLFLQCSIMSETVLSQYTTPSTKVNMQVADDEIFGT